MSNIVQQVMYEINYNENGYYTESLQEQTSETKENHP